jgi:hypothetical protein
VSAVVQVGQSQARAGGRQLAADRTVPYVGDGGRSGARRSVGLVPLVGAAAAAAAAAAALLAALVARCNTQRVKARRNTTHSRYHTTTACVSNTATSFVRVPYRGCRVPVLCLLSCGKCD